MADPPSTPLPNFAAFKKCKPDADGLYEVYFEYDDELEYQARALDIKPEIKMYAGTTVFEFPIVASVLFDGSGRVRGERMVTDPRQQVSRDRLEFWELANFVRQRFGEAAWDCTDCRGRRRDARPYQNLSRTIAKRPSRECAWFSSSACFKRRACNSSIPIPAGRTAGHRECDQIRDVRRLLAGEL